MPSSSDTESASGNQGILGPVVADHAPWRQGTPSADVIDTAAADDRQRQRPAQLLEAMLDSTGSARGARRCRSKRARDAGPSRRRSAASPSAETGGACSSVPTACPRAPRCRAGATGRQSHVPGPAEGLAHRHAQARHALAPLGRGNARGRDAARLRRLPRRGTGSRISASLISRAAPGRISQRPCTPGSCHLALGGHCMQVQELGDGVVLLLRTSRWIGRQPVTESGR